MAFGRATSVLLLAAASACGEDECLSASVGVQPGELVWEQSFAGAGATAIAVDRCNVAVAGYQLRNNADTDLWIGALTTTGRPLWHRRIHELFSESAAAVAFDDGGALLVAGTTDLGPYVGSDREAGWVGRFDPDAEFVEAWRQHVPAEDERESLHFSAVTTGPGGRVFSGGARLTRFGAVAVAVVQAHDADGSVAWTYDRGEDGSSWLRDAFMLPGGDVMFAGWHYTHGSERINAVLLLRLTAAGMLVSERLITDIPDTSSDIALAADGASLLVASRGWLRLLSLDGMILREATLDAAEISKDIAVGHEGEIFVAGRRELDDRVQVPWLARFDPDLVRVWDHVGERSGSADAVAVSAGGDAFIVGMVEAPPAGGLVTGFANHDLWVARFAR